MGHNETKRPTNKLTKTLRHRGSTRDGRGGGDRNGGGQGPQGRVETEGSTLPL